MRLQPPWMNSLCLGCALAACTLIPVAAVADDECDSGRKAPKDLTLSLSMKDGQTVFREGEIITLVARYSSSKRGKYIWNSRSYDRSGRLNGFEIFCIDPDRGTDPLEDYFQSQLAFFGGGLYSELELDSSPQPIELDLNEWQSLPTGSYTISIVGNRVSRREEVGSASREPIPIKSNSVSFQIVQADQSWRSTQLASAAKILDSPDSTPDQKSHAARVIRYLGIGESMEEAVRRFAATPDNKATWQFEAALWGSPYRDAVIRAMIAALENSDGKINRYFVQALVFLEMESDPQTRLWQDFRAGPELSKWWESYGTEEQRRILEYQTRYGVTHD